MEDLIRVIKKKYITHNSKFNEIIIEVLFSSGHLSYTVLADGVIKDLDLGLKITLDISKFVAPYIKESTNKMILTINNIEETLKFEFSEEYYISSKQELLFTLKEKIQDSVAIKNEELRDLLLIAKYAVNKVNLKELLTSECKLYLTIQNLQLVTDILPNFIMNKNKFLLLCQISEKDVGAANLGDLVLRKIDELNK